MIPLYNTRFSSLDTCVSSTGAPSDVSKLVRDQGRRFTVEGGWKMMLESAKEENWEGMGEHGRKGDLEWVGQLTLKPGKGWESVVERGIWSRWDE